MTPETITAALADWTGIADLRARLGLPLHVDLQRLLKEGVRAGRLEEWYAYVHADWPTWRQWQVRAKERTNEQG